MNTFTEKHGSVFPKIRFLDIYMAGHKGYIAGGCFKSIFDNKKIKDLDIFFESEKDFIEANAYFKGNADYKHSYESAKVIAYKNEKTGIRVELVRSTFDIPEALLKQFDFSIAKFAYIKKPTKDLDGNDSVEYITLFHVDFFEHLQCKKLVLEETILFPVSTWERSYKYRDYGFKLCKESKVNLLKALATADLEDIANTWYEAGID